MRAQASKLKASRLPAAARRTSQKRKRRRGGQGTEKKGRHAAKARARDAQEMSIERECKRRRGVRQRRDAPTRRARRVRARNMLDADARIIIIAIESAGKL